MDSILNRNSQGSLTVSEYDHATGNESSVRGVEATRSIPQAETQDNTRTALGEYRLTRCQKGCRIVGGMAAGTAVGAGAGAVVGALAGLFAGPVGSAVGAAVGGLVGGLTGGIMGTIVGVKKARKTPKQVLVSKLRSTNRKIYNNWKKHLKTREAWFKAWRKLPVNFGVRSSVDFKTKMDAENEIAHKLDKELRKINKDLSNTEDKINKKEARLRKLEADIEKLNNPDRYEYTRDAHGRLYRRENGFLNLGITLLRIRQLQEQVREERSRLNADSEYQRLTRSRDDLQRDQENKKMEIKTHEKEIAPLRKIERQVLKAEQLKTERSSLEKQKVHHEKMMKEAGFTEEDREFQYVGTLKA